MNLPSPKHCAHVVAAYNGQNIDAVSRRYHLPQEAVRLIVRHDAALRHDLRMLLAAQALQRLPCGFAEDSPVIGGGFSGVATPAPQTPSAPKPPAADTHNMLFRWRVATRRALHVAARWVRVNLVHQEYSVFVPVGTTRVFLRRLLRRTERMRRIGYLPHWIVEPPLAPAEHMAQKACPPVVLPSKRKNLPQATPASASRKSAQRRAALPAFVGGSTGYRHVALRPGSHRARQGLLKVSKHSRGGV